MKKYVYIVAAGTALLVLAGASWIVSTVRRPFVRDSRRRHGTDAGIAHYEPPAEAVRRRPSPAADATHRQFAVWG